MSSTFWIAIIITAPGTQALDPLGCLSFYLLFRFGDGVVVDIVMVNMLGGLLGDKSFAEKSTRSRGHGSLAWGG